MRTTLLEVCERFDELLATRAARIAELQVNWVDDSEDDEPNEIMFIATLTDGELLPVCMSVVDAALFDADRFTSAVCRMLGAGMEVQ